jgi:hypothetical protein
VKKIIIKYKILILVTVIIWFCVWQNNNIVITKSDYVSIKIPSDFDGFTIVQISDLHNKNFGENQIKILNKVQSVSPDIIIITGDLIDRRKYDLDIAMTFINGAVDIAPVYYVSGNHEAWSGKYPLIKKNLIDSGVNVLDNTIVEFFKGSSSISILGVSDPDFLTNDYMDGTNSTEMEENLTQLSSDDNFKILLSHRPELFDLYSDKSIDLIFSGHAHGGQFRIPLIGGLIAPDQGLFPKFTNGSYTKNSSTMFVSRGLGNSIVPIRIFNRPELVVVTLKNK